MTTQGNGSNGNGFKTHVDVSVLAESEGGESIFVAVSSPE